MSENHHDVYFHETMLQAIVRYHHGRSDYVAEVVITLDRDQVDGGYNIEERGKSPSYIPRPLLTAVMDKLEDKAQHKKAPTICADVSSRNLMCVLNEGHTNAHYYGQPVPERVDG